MTVKQNLNNTNSDEHTRCCLDCEDLGNKNIIHNCHCHAEKDILPNLGPLIDQKIESVFYLRERDSIRQKVVGIRLTTESGTLDVKLVKGELVVEYA